MRGYMITIKADNTRVGGRLPQQEFDHAIDIGFISQQVGGEAVRVDGFDCMSDNNYTEQMGVAYCNGDIDRTSSMYNPAASSIYTASAIINLLHGHIPAGETDLFGDVVFIYGDDEFMNASGLKVAEYN